MKVLGGLVMIVCVLVLVAAYVVYAPFGPSGESFVDIAPGTGTPAIAAELRRSGMIRSALAFKVLRVVKGGTLHAGEYRFDHPLRLPEVYARLVRGDVYTRALILPEGYNIFDVARAVESAGLGSATDFLAAERRNTRLIADLAPHADSLEGYLFPDTYRFSRHATPEQMLAAMVHRFRQKTAPLGLHAEVARTVILASLIEKEVSQDAERPLVAGVFTNRLAKGMPLETDPAVAYAALLEGHWRGTIYRSDLQSPSPYNTYRHPGLPPGPICNPGLAAFRAALAPARTDFLYFVSDDAGHTRFSATLKQHEDKVKDYRSAERARSRR